MFAAGSLAARVGEPSFINGTVGVDAHKHGSDRHALF
jgi:hypothetical protein